MLKHLKDAKINQKQVKGNEIKFVASLDLVKYQQRQKEEAKIEEEKMKNKDSKTEEILEKDDLLK